MAEKWNYLEKEPAADAPISDNPSGMYCQACRDLGGAHCAHPEYCGGMRLMRKQEDLVSDLDPRPQAFAMAYKPTIWQRLGFGRGHVTRETDEEEARLLELGYCEGALTTDIVVQLDWLDTLRMLVTRRLSIELRTRTFQPVIGAVSASAARVMAPGDRVLP